MSHARFERLLLTDLPLSPDDQDQLQRHLSECTRCASLHSRWLSLQPVLASGSMIRPRPGFVARWKARQEAESLDWGRDVAWRLFGVTSVAAASVAVLLVVGVRLSAGSLPTLLTDVLVQGLRWWIWARLVGEVSRAIAESLPTGVTIAALLGFLVMTGGAGVAAALGSFGLIRFSLQGVRK